MSSNNRIGIVMYDDYDREQLEKLIASLKEAGMLANIYPYQLDNMKSLVEQNAVNEDKTMIVFDSLLGVDYSEIEKRIAEHYTAGERLPFTLEQIKQAAELISSMPTPQQDYERLMSRNMPILPELIVTEYAYLDDGRSSRNIRREKERANKKFKKRRL